MARSHKRALGDRGAPGNVAAKNNSVVRRIGIHKPIGTNLVKSTDQQRAETKTRSTPELVKDPRDFLDEVEPARAILAFARAQESDGVMWFFRECWANYADHRFTAEFGSFVAPQFNNYSLSVEATKLRGGEWSMRVIKRTP